MSCRFDPCRDGNTVILYKLRSDNLLANSNGQGLLRKISSLGRAFVLGTKGSGFDPRIFQQNYTLPNFFGYLFSVFVEDVYKTQMLACLGFFMS